MKILVTSDAHGCRSPMERLIEQEDPDTVIFLGDGVAPLLPLAHQYSKPAFLFVRGNCDRETSLPEQHIVTLQGRRFYLTHGHREFVKTSMRYLIHQAAEADADVVLFGHTHCPTALRKDNQWVFNPGALQRGHYLLLELEGENLHHRFGALET